MILVASNYLYDTVSMLHHRSTRVQVRVMQKRTDCKMKENLLDIGYYRLGFYCFPFEVTFPRIEKRDHKFKEGTLFENVIQLYYFDFDVRNIFLRYISRIEINFRTKLIYIASNHFRDNQIYNLSSKSLQN